MRKLVTVIGTGLIAAILSLPTVAMDEGMTIHSADMFMIELVAGGTDPMVKPEAENTVADKDAATLADTGTADAWAGHALSPPSELSPTSKANMIATVKYVNPSG